MEEKKGKGKTVFLIIFIIISVLLGAYIYYSEFVKKPEVKIVKKTITKEIEKEQTVLPLDDIVSLTNFGLVSFSKNILYIVPKKYLFNEEEGELSFIILNGYDNDGEAIKIEFDKDIKRIKSFNCMSSGGDGHNMLIVIFSDGSSMYANMDNDRWTTKTSKSYFKEDTELNKYKIDDIISTKMEESNNKMNFNLKLTDGKTNTVAGSDIKQCNM